MRSLLRVKYNSFWPVKHNFVSARVGKLYVRGAVKCKIKYMDKDDTNRAMHIVQLYNSHDDTAPCYNLAEKDYD